MIIYRSLNESDIALNPLENGLYSKLNIELATKSLFDFLLAADGIELTKGEYKNELNEFMKNSVKYSLSRITSISNDKEMTLKEIRKHMKEYIENKDYDALLPYLISFFDITSTKNAHILNGNNGSYDWISFTKDLEALKYYYLKQKNKHMAVGMDSNINTILDGDTIAYDLSSKESVLANPFIYNKSNKTGVYEMTDIDSRAMRYANKKEEVIYYNHVPKDKLFILEPLQIDMLYSGMLDNKYLNASKAVKNTINHLLIYIIKYKLNNADDLTKYVFEKAYIESMPISTLSEISGINYYELLSAKENILNILNNAENTGILEQVKQHPTKVKVIERN